MKLLSLFPLLTITSITLFSPVTHAANNPATSFNAEQKQQIEQITRNYLLNNPEILVEVSQKLQEKQEQQMQKIEENAQKEIPKVAKELFNNVNSPTLGNATGDVTLVEFFDYQCSHCKTMGPVIESLLKDDNQVRVVYKEFPIFGNSSVFASKAALAANKQGKYAQFNKKLMETENPLTEEKVLNVAQAMGLNIEQLKKDMESKSIKNELEENLKLGQKLGIMGTPAFVVGSTKDASNPKAKSFFIPGATNEATLENLITEVRG